LAHFANEQKLLALSNGQTLRTIKGIWVRYQNDYINIGTMMPDNHLLSVNQFSFDNEHRLRLVRKIERIDYKDGVWRAYGIAQTMFYERRTEVRHFDTMKWDVLVKPNFLGVSNREVDEMTLPQLHQYLADQKTDRRISYPYRLAYLHRLLQPITTLVMMVLAIPFIFGPLRSSTMGSKLLVGASVGFGFYIINKFFGLMSQVMQWPAEIAAFVPTSVFALLGLYLMRRVR
jgi:lipopolysaccharide export system permease protein